MLDILAPHIPALIAFVAVMGAAVLTYRWNFVNAAQLRRQPFLVKQLDLCLEASAVVATLATTASKEVFDRAHARFLELFWGPLSVVENDGLSEAMVEFRKELNALIAKGERLPLKGLQTPSYKLSREVSNLILEAWEITTLKNVLEAQDPKLHLPSLR
ncbi:MAG TPA: hypothetical protein VJS15_09140 [Allosphingosinicella sp.]|nr:hypothetical protein [Allosphingosinicella sp.]